MPLYENYISGLQGCPAPYPFPQPNVHGKLAVFYQHIDWHGPGFKHTVRVLEYPVGSFPSFMRAVPKPVEQPTYGDREWIPCRPTRLHRSLLDSKAKREPTEQEKEDERYAALLHYMNTRNSPENLKKAELAQDNSKSTNMARATGRDAKTPRRASNVQFSNLMNTPESPNNDITEEHVGQLKRIANFILECIIFFIKRMLLMIFLVVLCLYTYFRGELRHCELSSDLKHVPFMSHIETTEETCQRINQIVWCITVSAKYMSAVFAGVMICIFLPLMYIYRGLFNSISLHAFWMACDDFKAWWSNLKYLVVAQTGGISRPRFLLGCLSALFWMSLFAGKDLWIGLLAGCASMIAFNVNWTSILYLQPSTLDHHVGDYEDYTVRKRAIGAFPDDPFLTRTTATQTSRQTTSVFAQTPHRRTDVATQFPSPTKPTAAHRIADSERRPSLTEIAIEKIANVFQVYNFRNPLSADKTTKASRTGIEYPDLSNHHQNTNNQRRKRTSVVSPFDVPQRKPHTLHQSTSNGYGTGTSFTKASSQWKGKQPA